MPAPDSFRIPILVALAALLSLMSAGYVRLESLISDGDTRLEATKANKDAIDVIREDVREIRTYLLGPKK